MNISCEALTGSGAELGFVYLCLSEFVYFFLVN